MSDGPANVFAFVTFGALRFEIRWVDGRLWDFLGQGVKSG